MVEREPGGDRLRPLPPALQAAAAPPAGAVGIGGQTLRDIHGHLGQTATVVVNHRTRPMRIVGTVVLPAFGQGGVVDTDLGDGAVVSASVLSVPPSPGPAARPGSAC